MRFWRGKITIFGLLMASVLMAGCADDGVLAPFRQGDHEPAMPVGPLPWQRGDVIGTVQAVRIAGDQTLVGLARSSDLGYVEIVAANPGIDPWVPGQGTEVLLPTAFVLPPGPRDGIVINLAEQRLYYFPKDGPPVTYPIGIGRDGYETPRGATKVIRKRAGPTWYPPASSRKDDPKLPRAVPPGPDNPLGTHALYLGWPQYLIHGTNEPYGVGRRISRGCIRLYPEDIVKLFPAVPKGTSVRVITAPVKVGWSDGELYLEVHPTIEQADDIEQTGRFEAAPVQNARELILAAAGAKADHLNWPVVLAELAARRGVPVRITGGPVLQAQATLAAGDDARPAQR